MRRSPSRSFGAASASSSARSPQGFDRFGIEAECPDAHRTESLFQFLAAGFGDRAVVSQDTTWCWYGKPASWTPEPTWHVLRFVRDVAPALRARGITDAQLDALVLDNPRQFFRDAPLPTV